MSTNPLHIDIPVTLTALRVAFSVPALTFEGDLPASLFHLQLLKTDAEDWKADADIVAVFHTNAGHVTSSDQAYDAGNADLLPGIRINTDAMARMTQLVQEGFVPITE